MAPWSNKLLSPSSRNNLPHENPSAASPARPRGAASRITEADILENAYGIPTLPGPSTPSKGRTGGHHGRSLSHPFPSLFAGRKKKQADAAGTGGNESTDDEKVSPVLARNTALNPAAKLAKVPDSDLLEGRCMTCDCKVRWPKKLKVFRCTVCAMINDLEPVVQDTRRGDGHKPAAKVGTYPPGSSFSQKVAPLSVGKTKQLLDQCITAYLVKCLKHEDADAVPSSTDSPALGGKEDGSYDNGDPDSQHASQTLPIHLSERPIDQADEETHSRRKPAHDLRADSAPYSTSSPGSFFFSHMEERDRSRPRSRSRSRRRGENPSQTDYFDNQNIERDNEDDEQRIRADVTRNLFRPLQEYIITAFGSFECINTSFSTLRPSISVRTASEGNSRRPMVQKHHDRRTQTGETMSEMDAKTLLLGDFAENGSWWSGGRSDFKSPERARTHRHTNSMYEELVTVKSPRLDWAEMNEWYFLVLNAGRSWRRKLEDLLAADSQLPRPSDQEMQEVEDKIMEAQLHVQRVLLKVIESLLKRPCRPLREPSDIRFLLIILACPLLYPSPAVQVPKERSRSRSRERKSAKGLLGTLAGKKLPPSPSSPNTNRGSSGQHSGIIKRILGLLSNVPNECHHHLVSWFARYSDGQFQRTTDLIGSLVTYRLTRQHGKKQEMERDPMNGLVPNLGGSGRGTSAALHAALGPTGQTAKKTDRKAQPVVYHDDWQIKAAARVMALFFAANNSGLAKRGEIRPSPPLESGHSAGLAARERAHIHGQILPTSDFYNTLLDYSDLVADFEAWEARRGKFSFCQYPFFLSIWAKIQIMEHDARRQMEIKAREAFFDSIMTHKSVNQYLVLQIRRDCLVEDSLKGVSEVVGSGSEEIKKGLRIEFKGEEGIDAGGLRKEWFLLLVRDVFNPEHGMFTYDEDSQFCYFNPNSFETTDQFFLVGVVLGLAIYNSTILDVAFPPFAFRKLLAAGPAAAPSAMSHAKPSMTYSLEDLTEFRPALAAGLRHLLEYEGDVESTFCRDFVADVDRYGQITQVPLCPDGESKPVTNANRREFVDLYVRYLLDTAVARQFEPFKRGFFTVCGGNALSLFRPEEIELLIRGSDEPLDINSLQAVSICENWGVSNAKDTESVVHWFWESFQSASPKDQRKLLSFVTGSDRIPAMGATNLVIKLSCLGEDCERFPVARTCFNMLSLWRYGTKEKLESKLWTAVNESEGFGLK